MGSRTTRRRSILSRARERSHRSRATRRIVALLCMASLAPALRAQGSWELEASGGTIRFLAPVFHGSVSGPPTPTPLPGLQCTLAGWDGRHAQVVFADGHTDPWGRFTLPGSSDLTSATLWLAGEDVLVVRESALGPAGFPYAQGVLSADLLSEPREIRFLPDLGSGWSVSELNAFAHARHAASALDRLLGPLDFHFPVPAPLFPVEELLIVFSPWPNQMGARIAYNRTQDRLFVYAGGADPEGGVFARSATVVAHEVAHRFVRASYRPNLPPAGLDEGFADFLATVVCGTPRIGEGLSGALLPRNVARAMTYPSDPSDPHSEGLRIAGALWHARARWSSGQRSGLTGLLRPLLRSRPRSATEIVRELHALDDDDGDPTNGAPNAAVLHECFVLLHGFEWPAELPVPR